MKNKVFLFTEQMLKDAFLDYSESLSDDNIGIILSNINEFLNSDFTKPLFYVVPSKPDDSSGSCDD